MYVRLASRLGTVAMVAAAPAAATMPRPSPPFFSVSNSMRRSLYVASRIAPYLRTTLSISLVNPAQDTSRQSLRSLYLPQRLRVVERLTTCQAAESKQAEVALRKGVLFEFTKESGKSLLAVVQKAEGKKTWIAMDQFGNLHSVKPQQVTYVVPSEEDFRPADIASFIEKSENLEDASLLEFAWEELQESNKDLNIAELAKMLYGDGALQCYTAHRLLASQQVFFRCKQKGPPRVYEPRTSSQVNDLQQRQMVEEAARQEVLSYVREVRLACEQPLDAKPPPSFWESNEKLHMFTESLKSYALELCRQPLQKKGAEEVLETLGLSKKPGVAVDLLIKIGVFPVHVNLELLRSDIPVQFSTNILLSADQIQQSPCPDANQQDRVDLTHLKVYTIDSDDAEEIDDGLSAVRLPDGRTKVWIHVADPTRWVPSAHPLDKEAKRRSTSIYLPTGTIPMFPMDLAGGSMSLRQGYDCCAVSVSVIFHLDGSLAESEVVCSTIRPTYRLSYDNATELLSMNLKEEGDLHMLAEVANLRREWRKGQGAIDVSIPEPCIKVTNPHLPVPSIDLSVTNLSSPAVLLVTEMMIVCGEAIATFGERNLVSLPYRGQTPREVPMEEVQTIPEGPCRAIALRRFLGRAGMSFMKPMSHGGLGIPGYVQFTSPIRRYGDLLAHYQVKAVLRGEKPLFSSADVESVMAVVNLQTREARKLQTSSTRYWALEYLRRQPRGTCYHALILRFLKEREPLVLVIELGIQANAVIMTRAELGSEITVMVDFVQPRKDVIIMREVLPAYALSAL
ncbi:unnamed protein product [Sphagnum jensenii]|uniref:RNB domain-containing protein n=1 Tax=Sphagnum jensenii TaxID=128206 RepID=A0ABP0WJ73_9BRYO